MGLASSRKSGKRKDQIIAIDLGERNTKTVFMQRKGDSYGLAAYHIADAPISEKGLSPDLLTDHVKSITQAIGAKTKSVTIALGVNESILRQTEVPMVPVSDMRLMIKTSPKTFLNQELPGYVFDCHILPLPPPAKGSEPAKKPASQLKCRALVGGARQQIVDDLQAAIKRAGLIPDMIVPGMVGPVNAFEIAHPDLFKKESLALVDIGFRNSTITILMEGEPILTRVVGIGGDKFTSGLAESMNISYPEAESIKIGMPAEVQSNLEPLLVPLGRELRASLDFFENQQDKTVSQVFVSGATAQSDFLLQLLQNQMMVPCKPWNPTATLQMHLPPPQMAEIERVASQLVVAIGAAVCSF